MLCLKGPVVKLETSFTSLRHGCKQSIPIRKKLFGALPRHDCAYHRIATVGIRHERAFDDHPVAFETQISDLIAANHAFVPGDIDLRREFVAIDAVTARICKHGCECPCLLRLGLWRKSAVSGHE